MPWWLSTTIRHDQISQPCKGESSLIFRPSVDTTGRKKSRPIKKQCTRWANALHEGRGFDRGNRGRSRRGQHGQLTREHNSYHWQEATNTPREFGRRGSHPARPCRQNSSIKCGYYGKLGHYKEEFRKKKRESASASRQLTNYATNSDNDDHGGMFIMRHKPHFMSAQSSTNTSTSDNVRFVDYRASNHMMSHEDWFQ